MADKVTKYDPLIGLRKAVWIAAYAAAAAVVESLTTNLNANQALSRYYWFPLVMAALALVGNWLRFKRKAK